ncbi:MAG: aminopeptidase N [Nocardioidaceae bacterium]
MNAPKSLSRVEARQRAALISVQRYAIAVDLTGLEDGDALRSVSTVTFSCAEPGATTFVDCAADVVTATLNGQPLPAAEDARIELVSLAADNTLVVESVQRSTSQSTGIQRSVDPGDGKIYVWMSFEPDDARRAWACFDQPDLKAPHAFVVTTPADWTVISNNNSPTVDDDPEVAGARRWTFPDTPPLSTYVPVVNAGPFHELRSERGGYDLGLYTRQSLAPFLERDAEELFDLTERGLTFYGEQFAMPFPQHTYDQVFVPDLGGAMENYGCITWTDAMIFRTAPTPVEREVRASVLLHEMAHMWFGDIVTMRWWDDLWLNEAFASWACYWAASSATEFTDAWAGFLAISKLSTYAVDRGPTSHAIRQPADDVAQAAAGFDAITYVKGASVLKQLAAYVGEDSFIAGLRSYFAKHAWSNATLDDLMAEFAAASGRELAGWTTGWLETQGPDTLTLLAGPDGAILSAEGPAGEPARPHRLDVGLYTRTDDGLVTEATVNLDVQGDFTPVPGVDTAALVLLNDNDLTYAAIRPDPSSLATLLGSAAQLPSAIARTVAVGTVWDLLITGSTPADGVVRCINSVLRHETTDSVIEPFVQLAVQAAQHWAPNDQREQLLSEVADTAIALAGRDESLRVVGTRALARTAVTDDQLAVLDKLAADDVDLGWRALTRLSALGRLDGARIERLRKADPDPDVWTRVLAVEAAQPSSEAKGTAWATIMDERKVPIGSLFDVAEAFWQPSQAPLLTPYSDRYLQVLPKLGSSGMLAAMGVAVGMFPLVGTGRDFVDRVRSAVDDPSVSPLVGRRVLERADSLSRILDARG